MPFAPEYIRCVLRENFDDAKALFLDPLLAIHRAHLVMLADRGIVSREDARTLRDGLDEVDLERTRQAAFDGTCEDLFFFIDRQLVERCGDSVAGRLHTARSRNDIDMALYRMGQRRGVLGVLGASIGVREALIALAGTHRETILALHTHTQPAQPSTVAHYLLAVIEQFERDAVRLRAAFDVTNRNPLGACAITGTGFPIDRELTSRLLGFSGPTGNTYGSIATVDYLLQNVTATAVLLAGLGRFAQDMLLWCTAEFAYMRLGDGFVQGSSIMPQKRNPVALEHARAIGSRALGEAMAVLVAVHNTPFGDIVDTEDDLQPLVDRMFHDAARAIDARVGGHGRRGVRCRASGAPSRGGLDHHHGTGRHAGPRPRAVVRRGAWYRQAGGRGEGQGPVGIAERGGGGGHGRTAWRTDPMRRIGAAGPAQPEALRRGPEDPWRPGARGDGEGARRVTVGAGQRPCMAGEDPGRPRGGRRRTECAGAPPYERHAACCRRARG